MIWLAGCRGLLGTDLGLAFDRASIPWVGTGREVDVADPLAIESFASSLGIKWVINCAAYTAVDKAESEPELCRRVNVEGSACLARWCESHDAALVHVSTDYVFSGMASTPYREEDPVDPRNVYGRTKAEAESVVRELCPQHLIVRTAWLYGWHGPNFVRTMLRLMGERDRLGVVADQRGAPTWTADLAAVLLAMISSETQVWGTYHASGEGQCTWYDFSLLILAEAQARGLIDPRRQVEIAALKTEEYPTAARRPPWSVLSKERLREVYGLTFPAWEQSLKTFLDIGARTGA